MSEFATSDLQVLLARIHAGDERARNDLLDAVLGRLESLTRKMLRGVPGVARWEQTCDVLTGAVMRLLNSLNAITPTTTRDFFNLAAVQIRRELLDLLRHYRCQKRPGAAASLQAANSEGDPVVPDPQDGAPDAAELDRWEALHEAIEKLPAAEREVVMLRFYHGWEQLRIAELLGVDERTVRRYWRRASELLAAELGSDLPLT
jgi:RNA polymerase sigma-70 factor (ECF subfamily)